MLGLRSAMTLLRFECQVFHGIRGVSVAVCLILAAFFGSVTCDVRSFEPPIAAAVVGRCLRMCLWQYRFLVFRREVKRWRGSWIGVWSVALCCFIGEFQITTKEFMKFTEVVWGDNWKLTSNESTWLDDDLFVVERMKCAIDEWNLEAICISSCTMKPSMYTEMVYSTSAMESKCQCSQL